jgi:hypothetical protein
VLWNYGALKHLNYTKDERKVYSVGIRETAVIAIVVAEAMRLFFNRIIAVVIVDAGAAARAKKRFSSKQGTRTRQTAIADVEATTFFDTWSINYPTILCQVAKIKK